MKDRAREAGLADAIGRGHGLRTTRADLGFWADREPIHFRSLACLRTEAERAGGSGAGVESLQPGWDANSTNSVFAPINP